MQAVAFLRGINVGTAKRVPMSDLRRVVEGLGHEDVRTVLNSGKLDVSGKAKGTKGGLVALNGNRVAVTGDAVIDASGVSEGGRVIIGGDQLGKAKDVVTVSLSDQTVIGPKARIDIGSSEGNGGFVETSSSGMLEIAKSTVVDVTAKLGKAGSWLLVRCHGCRRRRRNPPAG